MKRTRLQKLRTRHHSQHGHKWRSWQTITRAARIAKWAREIESFDEQTQASENADVLARGESVTPTNPKTQ